MRTLPALLLSLSICTMAWDVMHGCKTGFRVTVLHIIATPGEVKK